MLNRLVGAYSHMPLPIHLFACPLLFSILDLGLLLSCGQPRARKLFQVRSAVLQEGMCSAKFVVTHIRDSNFQVIGCTIAPPSRVQRSVVKLVLQQQELQIP